MPFTDRKLSVCFTSTPAACSKRNLNRPARDNNSPTLSFNFDSGHAFGSVDKNSFHLLRRQTRICFKHARCDGSNDRRGEGRSIDILVMRTDDVVFPQLENNVISLHYKYVDGTSF